MINWLKKKLLKSIMKDITKKLPKYKELALVFVDQHSEELMQKVKDAIMKLIEAEFSKYIDDKFGETAGK